VLTIARYRFEKRIHIPLPDVGARKHMFELHVGTTPCQLSQKDYRSLAEKTDGYEFLMGRQHISLLILDLRYSGSDISIVVRDALMQPVRKVISATHFKLIPSSEPDVPDKWTPCSPGDPDAVEKTWSDVDSDELLEPPLTLKDFESSLSNVRKTVTEADIKRHDEWTRESGTLT
jgi:vacuolar protein-sorting-associated protein 4